MMKKMKKKIIVNALFLAGIILILIIWSENHTQVNRYLGQNLSVSESPIAIFAMAVATIAFIVILFAGFITRKVEGAMKKIIWLNLIVSVFLIFPSLLGTIGLLYAGIVGFAFWPVLLLIFAIPNFIAITSILVKGELRKASNKNPS